MRGALAMVYVWQYWLWPIGPNYNNFPSGANPREIAALAKLLKEIGFTGGIRCQIDEAHGPLWSYPVLDFLRVYAMAKVMDDWDADVEAILDEHFRLFYGPAEKPMREFWEFIFTAPYDPAKVGPLMRREAEATPAYEWTRICSPRELEALGKTLERARAATAAETPYRARVDLVRTSVYEEYLVRASKEALGKAKE